MKTTFGTTIAALLAFALLGAASPAQQAAPPAEQAPPATDSAGAPAVETGSSDTQVETSSQPSNPSSDQANAGDDSTASGNSKVRIVRLSQVNGAVQMDRNTGRGFEAAMQNLPVIEGTKLKTDNGLAEVEFEDNSSLRVTPDTLIEFPKLELGPTGAKITNIHVLAGTVYVSLSNTKGNDFTLTFGSESVSFPPSSHARLQLTASKASLSVFDGNVQVAGAADTETLGKKRTLNFDLANQSQPALSKEVAENDYDTWDHQAVDYQKRYANSSAFGNSPNTYGVSDMNYYGSFSNVAGCGSMWRPYFASAAWNPYGSGLWAWYPGAGYSWVSPYPWGWTPYHSGSWDFCQGMGWGWRPGGSWIGLANAPGTLNPLTPLHGGRGPAFPVQPVRAPIAGQSTLLPVNLEKLPMSGVGAHDTFVFRNDSAGLGVPRGNLGKLERLSTGAEQHGSVSRPVYSSPISTAAGNGSSSIRQGTAGSRGVDSHSAERGQSGSGAASHGSMSSGAASRGGMSSGAMGSGSAGHGGSVSGSSHR